jgi:broad specificity phosphatase PhoE
MHVLDLRTLKNRYYGLRHGTSTANAKRIIMSDPNLGVRSYGLTEAGQIEVENGVMAAIKNQWIDGRTLIFFSDFRRTMESAKITSEILHTRALKPSRSLRERRFAGLDGQPDANYARVWEHDLRDPNHTEFSCESVNGVLERMQRFVLRAEQQYADQTILMVSHGDPLQILLAVFCRIHPNQHRQLAPFERGEIRPFTPTFHK